MKGDEENFIVPQVADVRRKQTSVLFGCLSAFFMLCCLIVGTWLLFDFINRTDHVGEKQIFRTKNKYFLLDMASYLSLSSQTYEPRR